MIERADIYLTDLGQPQGHEAGPPHPALVVSDPRMHAFELAIVCPITRTRHHWPSHVEIEPEMSGLPAVGYIQTEQVRCVSTSRLQRRTGTVDLITMHAVDTALRRNLQI